MGNFNAKIGNDNKGYEDILGIRGNRCIERQRTTIN